MRLKHYIIENISTEEVNKVRNLITKNCSDISKLYKKHNKVFYRGTSDSKPFLEKKGRLTDRKPRDTNIEIHNQLNRLFKKEFGWPVRNGISASNSHGQTKYYAGEYGTSYVFFPINEFKYCWSKSYSDLYNDAPFMKRDFPKQWSNKEIKEWVDKYMNEFTSIIETYTDKNLDKVLRMGDTSFDNRREVMFNSKKYYLVSLELYGMLNL